MKLGRVVNVWTTFLNQRDLISFRAMAKKRGNMLVRMFRPLMAKVLMSTCQTARS